MRYSVLVAVSNNVSTIGRTIESFDAQTYPDKELVIIDGGSTDGTVDILKRHSDKITYWVSEPDDGIYDAWNKALAQATGDWICFLGADDYLWDATVLERLCPVLADAEPRYRLVYGVATIVTKNGETIKTTGRPWSEVKADMADHVSIPHPGLMHHKSLFQDHGNFDISFRLAGDHDLLLRELKTRDALFVPEIRTVGIQHGGVSNTPSAMGKYLAEIARVQEKHSIVGASRRSSSSTYRNMRIADKLSRVIGDKGVRGLSDMVRRLRGKPPIWRDH